MRASCPTPCESLRLGGWTPYLGCWGEVRIERSLYRRAGEDRTLCPLELRAGIVEGYWTPAAASLATWSVAHLTPAEAAELFKRSGGMSPSRSTLDRLPKALSEGWEAQRTRFEESLRVGAEVPETATAVLVSLDGIMVPMKDGERQKKRKTARSKGKETRGPAGYREASSGTLSYTLRRHDDHRPHRRCGGRHEPGHRGRRPHHQALPPCGDRSTHPVLRQPGVIDDRSHAMAGDRERFLTAGSYLLEAAPSDQPRISRSVSSRTDR